MGLSALAKYRQRAFERIRETVWSRFRAAPSGDIDFPPDLDEKTNRESSPPPEENIDIRCIWAIEFYTESYIDSLVQELRKLGWDKPNGFGTGPDPVQWLYGFQRFRYASSSVNLGPVSTERGPSFVGGTRIVSKLPPYVSHAHARIVSLSPSLVAVSMCFMTDEALPQKVNESLRRDRTTYRERSHTGYVFRDPGSQKRRDYTEARQQLQGDVRDWFAEFLPGVLATEGNELPTCELVTAKAARPLVDRGSGPLRPDSYIRTIGFDPGLDSWHTESVDGLVLNLPRDSWHIEILVNEGDLQDRAGDGYRGSRHGVAHFLELDVIDVFRWWALLPLFEHFGRQVGRLGALATDQPKQILNELTAGAPSWSDIATVSREFAEEDGNIKLVGWTGFRFERLRVRRDDDESLGEILSYRVGRQAKWLNEAHRAARESVSQHANLLGAVENIRLQRSIRALTVVLTGLTITAIAVTVVMARCS